MRRDPHWRVPALLLASLLSGIIFAVAHHLFNTWLSNRAIDGTATPFSQRFAVGLGTAFAFIVKASFVLCVSIAYYQLMWRRLFSQATKVASIDSLYSALDDITSFISLKIWITNPILLLAAMLAWLLPIAAIIAPSSLTTRWSPEMRQRTEILAVSQLDFNRSTFALGALNPAGTSYHGPTSTIQRIAVAVAAGGGMLDFPSPGVNTSYTQTFFAPSLSCTNGSDDLYAQYNVTKRWLYYNSSSMMNAIVFVGWSTSSGYAGGGVNVTGPAGGLIPLLNGTTSWEDNMLDFSDPSSVFFAVGDPVVDPTGSDHTTILWQCSLFNSSYTIDVKANNGLQAVAIRNNTRLNGVQPSVYAEPPSNETLRPILAYQSILDAFARIVDSSIRKTASAYDLYYYETDATSVMRTSLALTTELHPVLIQEASQSAMNVNSLLPPSSNQTLGSAVEELFFNITLSMMSIDLYRLDASAFNSPPLTNVTFFEPYITYHYQPRNLAISYITSAAAALLFLIIGGGLIFTSGQSYTTKFSTILRATRGSELDALVTEKDKKAVDPLPKHIAQAKLQLSKGDPGGEEGSRVVHENKPNVHGASPGKDAYQPLPRVEVQPLRDDSD